MRDDPLHDDFLSQFRQAPDPAFARRLYSDLARPRAPWWRASAALAQLLLGGAATAGALLLAWTLALAPPAPVANRAPARQHMAAVPAEALLLDHPGPAPATLRAISQPAWSPAQIVLRVNASPLAHHHS